MTKHAGNQQTLPGFVSTSKPDGFFAQLRGSLRRPEFWAYSSWLDVATKYRRTRLGLLWLFLPLLVFVLVLGNFYAKVMGHDPAEYLPYLGCGYAIWRFMVMITNDSVSVLRSHKPFIMDGRVRLTDYTLRSISRSLFYFIFASIVVLGVLMWSPATSWYHIMTVFLTFPVIVVNMVWWSFCMALLGARYPDTGELIGTVLVLGFLLTPILWVGERFPADTYAGVAVRMNPAFHLIEIVRAPLLGRMPGTASLVYVACLTVLGYAAASVLCRRYSRYAPLWI